MAFCSIFTQSVNRCDEFTTLSHDEQSLLMRCERVHDSIQIRNSVISRCHYYNYRDVSLFESYMQVQKAVRDFTVDELDNYDTLCVILQILDLRNDTLYQDTCNAVMNMHH